MRHWIGGYSLLLTIAVVLLALRGLHYFLQHLFLSPLSLPSVAVWLGSSCLLLLWQVRGALRSVDKNLSISGDMVSVYFCYFALLVVFAVTFVQAGDALVQLRRPTTDAPRLISSAEAVVMPLSADGRVLSVSGVLSFAHNQALKRTLDSHSSVRTVLLDSEGGRVYAARAMALTVQQRGLDTRVETRCLSACTLVFLAGAQRSMGAEAKLGFHRYIMAKKQPGRAPQLELELDRDRQYFLARGVNEAFVSRMFKASHQAIWYPQRHELQESGVLIVYP